MYIQSIHALPRIFSITFCINSEVHRPGSWPILV